MKLFDLAASTPWAIEPEMLRTIFEIAARDNPTLEAVQEKLGRPLANARRTTTRDGVAIVPIAGPTFRYANLFTEVSGATSIQILATDLRVALDDPEIRAILLEVDSPGGQVDGTSELAQTIFAARGVKPIWAYVDGRCCSGAYWLASAAERVIAVDTAILGSIGVVSGFTRQSPEEKARRVEIVSSRAPNKRLDPESDAGRAQILAYVDATEDVFVAALAKQRGIDVEKVLAEFGQGGVMPAARAVDVGMADAIGTFEATLSALAANPKGRKRMSKENLAAETIPVASITAGYIAASHPAVAEALRAEGKAAGTVEGRTAGLAEGRAAGIAAERTRVLAIQAQGKALPGFDKLVAEMIADPAVTAEAAASRLVAANGEKLQAGLDALKGADNGPKAAPLAAGQDQSGQEDASAPIADRAKAAWEKDAAVRAEFRGNFASYLAFRTAEASGQARILKK